MENGLTKADLTAALTVFKTELKTELKTDLTDALTVLKTELKTELKAELRADWTEAIQKSNDDLMETMRQIETNLLTEFHRYGKGQQLRLHNIESRDAIITERLAIIEERLLHLESKRPPTF